MSQTASGLWIYGFNEDLGLYQFTFIGHREQRERGLAHRALPACLAAFLLGGNPIRCTADINQGFSLTQRRVNLCFQFTQLSQTFGPGDCGLLMRPWFLPRNSSSTVKVTVRTWKHTMNILSRLPTWGLAAVMQPTFLLLFSLIRDQKQNPSFLCNDHFVCKFTEFLPVYELLWLESIQEHKVQARTKGGVSGSAVGTCRRPSCDAHLGWKESSHVKATLPACKQVEEKKSFPGSGRHVGSEPGKLFQIRRKLQRVGRARHTQNKCPLLIFATAPPASPFKNNSPHKGAYCWRSPDSATRLDPAGALIGC